MVEKTTLDAFLVADLQKERLKQHLELTQKLLDDSKTLCTFEQDVSSIPDLELAERCINYQHKLLQALDHYVMSSVFVQGINKLSYIDQRVMLDIDLVKSVAKSQKNFVPIFRELIPKCKVCCRERFPQLFDSFPLYSKNAQKKPPNYVG